jgi:hypothetical protein
MDIRRVVLGWLLYVAATVLVYWVFFNARFASGRELPMWLIIVAVVMAVAAFALLLWWVRRVAAGDVPAQQIRDYSNFFLMIVVTGVIGDALAVAVEVIVGAPSLPMMIPIATVTYCLCVVWIYWRYYRRRGSEATG